MVGLVPAASNMLLKDRHQQLITPQALLVVERHVSCECLPNRECNASVLQQTAEG